VTAVAVPGVTGRIDRVEWSALRRYWFDDDPTGHEYGLGWAYEAFLAAFWDLPGVATPPADPPPAPPADDIHGRAAALAVEAPHVARPAPPRPRLSGNLAADVHEVCGLTWAQIATLFAISERAVASWRVQGVPRHRLATMEALRAIGAIMVGGLDPPGVSRWLTAGSPSRLDSIAAGRQAEVLAEARAYLDTPAT